MNDTGEGGSQASDNRGVRPHVGDGVHSLRDVDPACKGGNLHVQLVF